ncbi:MAG TPA: hypothetical protein VF771_04180, partial [Longimicrobiaceae bacterium]
MAPATYNVTTSRTDLQGLWRKVQGTLREVANFIFPEWDDLKEFKNVDIDWSAREITAPLDISEGAGVASIPEGGYEARPSSPTVVDATWTWCHLNKRFTVSKISKMIQQRNRTAMLVDQFKFQGKKALEALGQWIADSFYGFSTGVRGVVSSISSGAGTTAQTIVIKDAYGITGLGSTGPGAYVAQLFRKDEYVAFIRSGALVANSIGQINAAPNSTTPSISVTFAVAPTLAANDQIVFANSLENTTLEGTDYLKSLNGFLDALTSVSFEGVSSSTYSKWAPQYTDTGAGRMTNIKIRRMRQAIENIGAGTLTDIRWSFGVENDVFAQLQAGVMFPDMNNLQMDGDPKFRGVRIKATRAVPPGYVFGYDRNSVRKMVLLPSDPRAPTWDDGEKVPDRSMFVFPIDYPVQMV